MYLNGINALSYLQGGYGLGSVRPKTSTHAFQDVLQKAAGRSVPVGTYSWHLNNSGQYPQAQLKFAVANAYQQALLRSSYQTCMPTKTNWVNVVNSLMQDQYSAGNLQGYLNYSKFLGFLL